jgi:CRP-like cAMP-binding protein
MAEPGRCLSPFGNQILARLRTAELGRLRPHLQRVTLVLGQVLQEDGQPIEDVYFLEDGLASLVADTGPAGPVEVALIGREGLVGVEALLAEEAVASYRAFLQVAGTGFRIRAEVLRAALDDLPGVRACCRRHFQALLVQMAQGAACNARHPLVERLARWLLKSQDRLGGEDIPITQETVALMLGVQRSGVTLAASKLQEAGLIGYARGRITVRDRAGLEAAACACHRIERDKLARILRPRAWSSPTRSHPPLPPSAASGVPVATHQTTPERTDYGSHPHS